MIFEMSGLYQHLLSLIFISAVTFSLVKIINALFQKHILKISLHLKLLQQVLIAIIYFLAFIMFLSTVPHLQGIAYSLLASSGIFAIIGGFASQQVFVNFLSGVFLTFSEAFAIGDYIKIITDKNIIEGYVTDITLRHTVLKSKDNKIIIVPNSIVNSQTIEKEHKQ